MKKREILPIFALLLISLILTGSISEASHAKKRMGKGYTVGGTVSGLRGTLVLKNNGGDDLVLTLDGPFVFPTLLADGSAYDVTVADRPVLQNCLVTNGSGLISSADVTDVTVACTDKSWTHPTDPSDSISPEGHWTLLPQVAMDNSGNAIIVWPMDADGFPSQIFKNEYRNGSWTYPTDLADSMSPEYAKLPQVAMDDNGNAIVVWIQRDGYIDTIFKSEFRHGSWTYPAELSDNISLDRGYVAVTQVAMDNNGNAIVVWCHKYDSDFSRIFMSEYRNGSWTHPADLTDSISPGGENYFQDAHSPQVAMDNNGNAVVVWSQMDGSFYQIFKSEFRHGSWTHPTDLSDNISLDRTYAWRPQVAMDNNGNAIVVWHASSRIFKSEFRHGSWTHPTSLSDNISPDETSAVSPQVAMDNNGNAVVVWQQRVGTNYQIFKSEFRYGSWTYPADLSDSMSPDGVYGNTPQVAMDNNGDAIVVWEQWNGTSYQILMSEFR